MPQFKKYKLSELCTKIGSGATPRGGDASYKSHGISLIRSQNVLDFTFSKDGLAFIDEQQANELSNVELKDRDVLLNITGDSVARVCQVPNSILPGRVNQHVAILRANRNVLHPEFLKYYLLSRPNKEMLLTLASTGATRKALTKGMLEEFEIEIPDEEGTDTQTRIAFILSSLDDKIELNRRTNATLEAMAQTLFKKYFVDDIDSDNLPEGWNLLTLGDSVSKSNTGADAIQKAPIVDYDSGIRCARVGDMTNKRPYHEWGFCEIDEQYFENFKLLKYDILITRTATLGINTIIWEEINAVFNNGLIRIRINPEFNPLFVYQALQTLDYEIYIERISGDSSTRPNMQIGYLLDYPLVKPPKKLQDEFSKQIENLLGLKYIKESEIMQLTRLRDTILPKLMSGEIEVNAAEKELVN